MHLRPRRPAVTSFAFVYVLYYWDPNATGTARAAQYAPQVYTTLSEASAVIYHECPDCEIELIQTERRWRGGHWWIDRVRILDTNQVGLEYETLDKSNRRWLIGRLPLRPPAKV